ncbi:MAG: DUF4340 domain-containing protein [Nitrospiraceae bacterium]|nr:MAG: DUF4340 domain-containing protein [Nitrospiraceae bacterium]
MHTRIRVTVLLLALSVVVGSIYFFYIVPLQEENRLKAELSQKFFRVDKSDIEFLRIQNPKGTFNLVKSDGGWRITSPLERSADREVLRDILDRITSKSIVKIISTDREKLSDFSLHIPVAVLNIGYAGTIDALAIGDQSPSKTGYYAFVKGINAIFLVNDEIAKIRNLGLYDVRDKTLFRFDPEIITSIRISKNAGSVILRKEENAWYVASPLYGKADMSAIQEFLDELLLQRAIEFYDDGMPNRNMFSDTIELQLTDRYSSLRSIEVHFWGTGANEGTVAYEKGEEFAGRLPRDFWIFLDKEASHFRYRNLFNVQEEDISQIRVTKNNVSYTLARKGNNWLIDGDRAHGERVTAFIWLLKDWKAAKILPSFPSGEKDNSILEIVVDDREGHSLGRLMVFDKIESESIGFDREIEEFFLHFATSDNLENDCAVSGLELEKIPAKEHFIQ